MKYPKKALAFIGAVALLFQGGCSAPDQENQENWETVIECQYEDMGISPNQQFLIAKKGGLYGAYVKNGDSYELKIPFQYVHIAYDSYEDANLFCYLSTFEVDMYDAYGKKCNDRPFRAVWNITKEKYKNGYPVSYNDADWGFISKTGEWIVEPAYDHIQPLEDGTLILSSKDGDDWVDTEGKTLLPFDEPVSIHRSSVASGIVVTVQDKNSDKESTGVLGGDGEYKIPPIYKEITAGQDNAGNSFFMCIAWDGKGYVLDERQNVLFEYDGKCTIVPTGNRQFIVMDSLKNPSWMGLLSDTGEWIIYNKGVKGIEVAGELVKVLGEETDWLYDTNGNILSEFSQKTVFLKEDAKLSDPLAYLQTKELKWGFTSGDGSVSIAPEYVESYGPFPYNDLLMVSRDGKWGCVNYQNETKIEFQYSNILVPFTEEGYAYVTQGNTAGIINTQGETVVPFVFENPDIQLTAYTSRMVGTMAIVKKDGTYGCIQIV